MKLLSLDTSAEVCTAAVCDDERLIAEMTVNTGNTHSQTLLPVIEQILKISETEIDDIDLYAQVSQRLVREDILSIVDTYFMPNGIECDTYSILGTILELSIIENEYS